MANNALCHNNALNNVRIIDNNKSMVAVIRVNDTIAFSCSIGPTKNVMLENGQTKQNEDEESGHMNRR